MIPLCGRDFFTGILELCTSSPPVTTQDFRPHNTTLYMHFREPETMHALVDRQHHSGHGLRYRNPVGCLVALVVSAKTPGGSPETYDSRSEGAGRCRRQFSQDDGPVARRSRGVDRRWV